MISKIVKISIILQTLLSINACQTRKNISTIDVVDLPFIKNSKNECYYLDSFMPIPDNLVSGKFGNLDLRYYTYNTANYKDWEKKQVILSFYSQNERCWSLFEEYYITK